MKSEYLLKYHMADIHEPKETGGWCYRCHSPFTTRSGNRNVCDVCLEAGKSCALCGSTDMSGGIIAVAGGFREGYCRKCRSKVDNDFIACRIQERLEV